MLNRIDIQGRITKDPELRTIPSTGTSTCTITVACERDFRDKNGSRETDFIDVVCWRQTAEYVNSYIRKGDMIVVSGRLQLRDWKDKNGNNRRTAEVIAESVYSVGRAKYEAEPRTEAPALTEMEDEDGDLPF